MNLLNLLPIKTAPDGHRYRLKPGPKGWAVGLLVGASLLAIVLFIFAFFAGKQSFGASSEPTPANLADMEKGTAAPNNHIELKNCYVLYSHSFFWYETTGGKPTASSTVRSTFTPVIAPTNPFILQIRRQLARYNTVEKIPSNELPPIKNYVVLLRTDRFSTVGQIPLQIEKADIHGLINNHMVGLEDEEKELIKRNCPGVDLDKVLIVWENKRPASMLDMGLLVGGGVLLIGGGAFNLYRTRKMPMRIEVPTTDKPPAKKPAAKKKAAKTQAEKVEDYQIPTEGLIPGQRLHKPGPPPQAPPGMTRKP